MERWLQSIYSDGTDIFITPKFPKLASKISIGLRVWKENPIQKIYLRTSPEGEEIFLPMEFYKEDSFFSWYTAKTKLVPKMLHYRFKIVCPEKVYWYTAAGVFEYTPSDNSDFRIIADFRPPKWLASRVFYQIFPDTFCNMNPEYNPSSDSYEYQKRTPHMCSWEEKPGEYSQSHSMDFFGGDLPGIQEKIPYLKQLGINAIYLNPIFQAPSNHRYDTQDFFRIDPHLGTNEDFSSLVKALHKQNIRIILDGVFNHTGIACSWFNKCAYYPTQGAYQSTESLYFDFYTFSRHPHQYATWCGINTLPKLNYRSQNLREMIYRGKNSVMQFWMQPPFQIDGWRLDVSNMLGRQEDYQNHCEIFAEMRKAMKDLNPNAYFMGEHFFDPQDILQGNCLDAVMNYFGFTLPVREWLTGVNNKGEVNHLTSESLDVQLIQARSHVSWQIASMQYNLLNSHDLPRIISMLEDPKLNELALLFLITYIGIPAIYYGDEIAMKSNTSVESSRQPMIWDEQKWDKNLWDLHRILIEYRKESQVLQNGGIKTLYTKDDVYCYARFYEDEVILVCLNRGESKHRCRLDLGILGIPENICFKDKLSKKQINTHKDGLVAFTLMPYTGYLMERFSE